MRQTGFTLAVDVRASLKSHEVTRKVNGERIKEKLFFLPWLAALKQSGFPKQKIIEAPDGRSEHEVFGGAIVKIEQTVGESTQVIHLPIQDGTFNPIAYDKLTPTDVANAISRCKGKAASMCCGVGLDLYAGFSGDGQTFASALGAIGPETDLASITPLVNDKGKGVQYVKWAVALAAAMLADPAFGWTVEDREVTDAAGVTIRQPYKPMGNGYAVGVTVRYRGLVHTEWLAITGYATVETKRGPKLLDNQPLTNPNVNDWNKAVMRCLAKAIAVASGYGFAIYAKADDAQPESEPDAEPAAEVPAQATPVATADPAPEAMAAVEPPAPVAEPTPQPVAAAPEPPPAMPVVDPALAALAEEVRDLALATRTPLAQVQQWFSVKALGDASKAELTKMRNLLRAKKAKSAAA